MNGYGGLASTGLGTMTIFGMVVDQVWLVGGAVVLIGVGVLFTRWAFRKNKSPKDV